MINVDIYLCERNVIVNSKSSFWKPLSQLVRHYNLLSHDVIWPRSYKT